MTRESKPKFKSMKHRQQMHSGNTIQYESTRTHTLKTFTVLDLAFSVYCYVEQSEKKNHYQWIGAHEKGNKHTYVHSNAGWACIHNRRWKRKKWRKRKRRSSNSSSSSSISKIETSSFSLTFICAAPTHTHTQTNKHTNAHIHTQTLESVYSINSSEMDFSI